MASPGSHGRQSGGTAAYVDSAPSRAPTGLLGRQLTDALVEASFPGPSPLGQVGMAR
jgi:hypothetical protein